MSSIETRDNCIKAAASYAMMLEMLVMLIVVYTATGKQNRHGTPKLRRSCMRLQRTALENACPLVQDGVRNNPSQIVGRVTRIT